jgi:hypothetical protein
MAPPQWAETVGWIFLAAGLVSAAVILVDLMLLGYRQEMRVMNAVHPITALYLGPVWLWLYFTRARRSSSKWIAREKARLQNRYVDVAELKRESEATDDAELRPWHVTNAVSHCGAGCTLGDITGEWIVFAAGLSIAGAAVWPELMLDFVLAWTFGIAFQYFTIAPMRPELGRLGAVWSAIRADTLSIVGFQAGMSVWMILSAKVLWSPPLPIDSAAHWWMMQVAMIIGFATSWPVNRWLIGRSWKEKMDYRRHLAMALEQETDGGAARRAA